ncbi:MAG: endopeptidase La [Deltaproteobacteria bacterium]|nr:endopeptidase La [Deltaproteobacteria bacterium]
MSSKKKDPKTEMKATDLPSELPILPLRNSVFFPGAVMPLTIGRAKTIRLIEEVTRENSLLGIVTQKAPEIDDPTPEDMFRVGTAARIIKLARTGKDGFNIVVQGIARFRVDGFGQEEPFFISRITPLMDAGLGDVEADALALTLKSTAREVIDLLPEIPVMAKQLLESITEPGHLADIITANIDATIEEKQEVLEAVHLRDRLKKVLELISRQLEVLKLSNKINTQVKGEMSKTQREYYLRQQLKAIKEELGEREEDENGLEELEKRLKKAALAPEAEKAAQKELRRMRNMQPSQAEYTVARTYLEWMADLPWSKSSDDNLDLDNAKNKLDGDHYGLDKIKKRIIEYLAVRKLKNDMKGPILCFVGPPGVGKTSLGRSIADALGRKFVRISLGGVRDEAEIRGHRRTYIGALPGRIIQGMKKAATNNPVFLLDEVDKLGHDFRGDPAAALLEVLDPEQNNTFSDHYLDVPFDLSKVLFIATANQMDPVPPALKDRMEVLELPGYTREEKLQIAHRHLVPKQLREHGIDTKYLDLGDKAVELIISGYTREAGVRNLEREIAGVCRWAAVKVAKGQAEKNTVTDEVIAEVLGPIKFESEVADRTGMPGVATGLVWTPYGGEITFVEMTKMAGKGTLTLTGKLGDVLKESAQAALSYVRARGNELGISKTADEHFLEKQDIHIHLPEGAMPKDGPSAGVTMVTALVSLLTGRKCRPDVAMTGEVTLRGLVLPVGGVKEKVLAAHRAGIKRVILPARNEKDIIDIPEQVRREVEFVFAKRVDEVLAAALEGGHPTKADVPLITQQAGQA